MKFLLELKADYESAREIGPWLDAALRELNMPQAERAGELELALQELAINIVDHAYANSSTGRYRIELGGQGQDVRARFFDRGKPFRSRTGVNLDEPRVGGYGLFIVEQLAEIAYERVDEENCWTLIFGPESPQTKESM